MAREEEEWTEFHIPAEAGALWDRQRKRTRFLADANVPLDFVEELREAGLDVMQGPSLPGLDDPAVLAFARREDRVLLTFDRDFWDERRYPTHTVLGVLIVGAPNRRPDAALQAMTVAHHYFVRHFPGDSWNGVKVLAYPDGFKIRLRTCEGRTKTISFKVIKGILYFQED